MDVFASRRILNLRSPQGKKNAYDKLESCSNFRSGIVAYRCHVGLLVHSGDGERRARYFRVRFNGLFVEREPAERDRQLKLGIHEHDP